jgi:hypothetical protein
VWQEGSPATRRAGLGGLPGPARTNTRKRSPVRVIGTDDRRGLRYGCGSQLGLADPGRKRKRTPAPLPGASWATVPAFVVTPGRRWGPDHHTPRRVRDFPHPGRATAGAEPVRRLGDALARSRHGVACPPHVAPDSRVPFGLSPLVRGVPEQRKRAWPFPGGVVRADTSNRWGWRAVCIGPRQAPGGFARTVWSLTPSARVLRSRPPLWTW